MATEIGTGASSTIPSTQPLDEEEEEWCRREVNTGKHYFNQRLRYKWPSEFHMSGDYKEEEERKSYVVENFSENLKVRVRTSLGDIRTLRFWRAVVAEYVGTLILVLAGCGSCIPNWNVHNATVINFNDTEVNLTNNYTSTDIVQIALTFGLSVSTIIWVIAHISGGHVNPAVTCAMLITRHISLARACVFIAAQLLGATTGAGILLAITPGERHGTLGCTLLGPGIEAEMGVTVEFCITFVLVLTVFASCDKRRKDLGGSFPLTIGLSVTMCHLFAVRFTGSSMNTARSFGPALVMGIWNNHWVYWAGPILGGVVSGLFYDNVFAVNASIDKCRGCLLASQYDDDNYVPKKYRLTILEESDVTSLMEPKQSVV
ncbi:hypothetical protein CHS0354_023400 [Potamilus streckersoni]|uniref:Uncharacterized protein n=1 Tax=Potamilus streckersoni TaxID=2493646 RepID=A0AAE0TAQ4_9BIVA|nr:hypothetical protein CHS0354_023400 [Potamilus streckersoni]